MIIKEVGDRVFIFQFDDEHENDRVLMRQTWSFNKSLIVLKEFDGYSSPKIVNLEWCSFWIQIYRLPLSLINEKIGVVLGELLREVLEVNSNDDQIVWEKWIRVRANINLYKPLKMGKLISVEGERKILALFKYKRLPDFCYVCRKVDHNELDCIVIASIQKDQLKIHREFGPWM